MDLRKVCERIWDGYKGIFARTAYVPRKGFESVGMTKETEALPPVVKTFKRRGESGLEHQAKVAWLAAVFADNFPRFFGDSSLDPSCDLFYSVFIVGLCHDVGEVTSGDVLDDGNALSGTKDETEREVFNSLMHVFRHSDARLAKIFKEFQDKSTHAGKALHALDKIESILTLLFLEQFKHYGAMDNKPLMTDSDRHFVGATRTSCTTDCWAARVKSLTQGYPKEITEPVFELLRVAVEDVRGEMFEWWGDEGVLPE